MRFVTNLGGGPRKHLENGFNGNEMILRVYWRMCHEFVQTGIDPTSL
jgi:hypothetical protein